MIKLLNFYHRHIVICVTYEKYQNHISVYILNKCVETTMYTYVTLLSHTAQG